jgi:large subunit ribosomal protein L18
MGKLSKKVVQRRKRHLRIRRKVEGSPERPRLSVYRSSRHISAQVINDWEGVTLVSASTLEDDVVEGLESTSNIEAAKAVGLAIGKRALEAGITAVVFDRGGWPMHGRIRALAEGAREGGLEL